VLFERRGLRVGLNFRVAGRIFRALCGYGIANEEGEDTCEGESTLVDIERIGGASRDGESGELGEGEVDFEVTRRNFDGVLVNEGVRVRPLDGDLDSECRNCLKAEAGSTWWMCVGDGRCKVPPKSADGEYETMMRA